MWGVIVRQWMSFHILVKRPIVHTHAHTHTQIVEMVSSHLEVRFPASAATKIISKSAKNLKIWNPMKILEENTDSCF